MLSDDTIEFAFTENKTYSLIAYLTDSKNQIKFISTNTAHVHAEVACLNKFISAYKNKGLSAKKISRIWSQHTLVVLRYTIGARRLACSKPCKFCVKKIKSYPIKKVIYVNAKGKLETTRVRDLESDYITHFDKYFNRLW